MAIVFCCPRCDQRYSVPETMAGRRVTCKKCGQERTVPSAGPVAAPTPKPAARSLPTFRDDPPVIDEDDDLDEPLDDFDELPVSAALAPRPKKTAYQAPTPRTPKPKKARRRVDDVSFPPLVTFGLGLIGLLMLLGAGSLVVTGMSRGDSRVSGIGFMMLLGIASIGLMVVAALKVVFHAQETRGGFAAFLCFFVPLYLLGYVLSNFEDTKKYVLWYVAGIAGIFLTAIMLPSFAAENMGPDAEVVILGGPGSEPETTVQIAVKGLKNQAEHEVFEEGLKDLLPPQGNRGISGQSSRDGVTLFALWPVRNPKAIARSIAYAKSIKVNGRSISLTAAIPADVLTNRREADAEAKAAQDVLAASNAPSNSEDNPFQEKKATAPVMTFDPNAGPIDKLLHETRNQDGFKARDAIKALASGVPDDRKTDVVAALVPLLDTDVFTTHETMKTLAALRSPEAIAAIVARLDKDSSRDDAIKALGEIGDPRAAEAVAEHLKEGWPHATQALITFGPAAEAAVIPKLSDPDRLVRQRALDVLEKIGGVETIKAMQALPADPDDIVRMKANKAMEQILQRTGPVR